MAPIPVLSDYDVSPTRGFLPTEPPLQRLPDPYYEPWEYVVGNLQGLMLSKRIREVVDGLPVLSTERLSSLAEWRRAYCAMAFISHAYIWGGNKPAERIPPPISKPFIATCKYLELPSVATFASVCLWNWKPIFESEPCDTLANLDIINTFTGSLDEKWFYMISVAIEAKGGPMIPLMLDAIEAAGRGDTKTVTAALGTFAETLDDICATLVRMYDDCDPHVFYHRIRPFLAGSKNMAAAGLPNGVIFDNGGPINKQRYVQFSGGSNAQSSLLQFFDLVLGVEHRPTGEKKQKPTSTSPTTDIDPAAAKRLLSKSAPPPNFIREMQQYMPGPHARFLTRVAAIANLHTFVQDHQHDLDLCLAFDACVAMLSSLRDKHIQMVSRYIVIKSREAERKLSDSKEAPAAKPKLNLAARPRPQNAARTESTNGGGGGGLKGTGGTFLIPLLRQARDETGEPAIGAWARRLLASSGKMAPPPTAVTAEDAAQIRGAAAQMGPWRAENSRGGLCLF